MSEDSRHEHIVSNVEKLVECLTGDTVTEKQRRSLEQHALHKIRHHRYLSVNSHEVRRAIDTMIDRFRFEGMTEQADAVQMLSTEIIEHAGWESHYVVDVQYSLLEFLFSMTNSPVQNVRRNLLAINERILSIRNELAVAAEMLPLQQSATTTTTAAACGVDWVALLSEDFIPSPSDGQESDSSLSDWSDIDDYETAASNDNESVFLPSNYGADQCLTTSQDESYHSIMPNLQALKPPKAHTDYSPAEYEEDHLRTVVHSNWWQEDSQFHALTPNDDPCSNFAIAYVQHLNRDSRLLIKEPVPKTTSESCLVREIILMFFKPASCGYFELHAAEQQISVRKNITISSMSSETLRCVLETEVLPAMVAKYQLHCLIHELTYLKLGPGTLTCFAWGIHDLLQPINSKLIEFERRLIDQAAGKLAADDAAGGTTLIAFLRYMDTSFKRLLVLKALANEAVVDKTAPAHVQSVRLLCVLYEHTLYISSQQQLAIALLLVSLQSYSRIIDDWWLMAQLNDRHCEYIVDCLPAACADYGQRITKRLKPEYEQQVQGSAFYQLLLQHAMEAGETQDLLASADLLGNIILSNMHLGSHYDDLKRLLLQQLPALEQPPAAAEPVFAEYEKALLEQTSQLGDPLLMSIFTLHITEAQKERSEKKQKEQESTELPLVLEVLQRLENSKSLLQSQLLPRSLTQVHGERYALANVHVMRWYRDELKLVEHVRFVRQLLLLGADYLLHPFYVGLFRQIEDSQDWARESLLTLEITDVLDTQYASHSSLLKVHIISQLQSQSNKAYEALDAISIEYAMPTPLCSIITPDQMYDYNAIWRMLLKVKWAGWKLAHMRFIRRDRHDVFAPLDLLGLTLRRLEILRFWLINLISSLHTHLCVDAIQSLGVQFEQLLSTAETTRQLRQMHSDYIKRLLKQCLLTTDFADFRIALEQVFHLIFVLDLEWNSCFSYLNESHALSVNTSSETLTTNVGDADDPAEGDRTSALEYLALNQVNEIELTYVRCHQKLAEMLTSLVYKHDHKFLNSLELAINASLPC
ncbi:uncharacterized protein LOC133849015 [Drosophila sulfurigaster albostrigata]|uniref:uncharacterized protein LOC133849015 n=1 Tax=Drosophila sulfurigaster albostrigata TaxID=89887 RepID=UPI002D21A7B6|nr:uncharacterized protein LOC133849015 [Drosophila sulfurigaster albostrigata]